ncbi:probable G-protein coupled receptor 34 [Amphiura filiformis]|uniref:probable G-protein coupled receptor 34 n=1 Tax=Amphiura filiformis TaxID=82378 RepID=UPI003B225C75
MNNSSLPSDCNIYNTWNFSQANETAQAALWTGIEGFLFTVGLPVIFCVGVVGNLAFLFALFRVPVMRTVTNAYLANIAAADLLFVTWSCSTYSPPYFLNPVRNNVYWKSAIGCGVSFGLAYIGYFASIMLITIVTAERYFAICRPFQHRMIAGKKHTVRMIVVSWITAVVLSAITLPSWSSIVKICIIWPDAEAYQNFPTLIRQCNSPSFAVFVFGEIVLTVPFFIILPVNLFMYGRIILTLSKRTETFADKEKTELATRARNQVARLLIVNGSVFLFCQAPYRIISIHYIALLAGHRLFSRNIYGSVVFVLSLDRRLHCRILLAVRLILSP